MTSALFSLASICIGAILGALRSKIFSSKGKTNLHYYFYGFSILVLLICLIFFITDFKSIVQPDGMKIAALSCAVMASITLSVITKTYLTTKDTFHVSELDPIINKFTEIADKREIKLFGGDLNFFGNSPQEVDMNAQYTFLRSRRFTKISILCEEPDDNYKRIRYGKILHDMPQVEFRYYSPKEADLKVRGRIIEVDRAIRLLIYIKASVGHYQTIETDTSNSKGKLYDSIWDLVWSLAKRPSNQELANYKNLFTGNNNNI